MSLKWKFMIAPLIALLTIAILIGIFYRINDKQNEILEFLQIEQKQTSYKYTSIANQLAINHTQIFSLLRDAPTINDEGIFYDLGRGYLLKIHAIESQFADPKLTTLIPPGIKEKLVGYRVTTTNVILTASVDLELAFGIMNDSTFLFNELNNQLLSLNETTQKSIQSTIIQKRKELKKAANISILIALILIVVSTSITILFSSRLSKKLRYLIGYLREIVIKGKPNDDKLSIEADEIKTLNLVAVQVTEAIKQLESEVSSRIKAEETARNLNRELEDRVAIRTQDLQKSNDELISTLEKLQQTQKKLIENDKMAALGGLVAGIAHELNTPIGTALTGITLIQDKIRDIIDHFDQNVLTKRELKEGLNTIDKRFGISLISVQRAAQQIKSFKLVAVDTTADEIRNINLKSYLEDILMSLKPRIKKGHRIKVACPEKTTINSYPGALVQIFTNLIMNSLIHGFNHDRDGTISIAVTELADQVKLLYCDNGKGISSEVEKVFFNPFFTTNRGAGGTGLGTHIIYNLVTQQLKGDITIVQNHGPGLCFCITIPKLNQQMTI
ncbi:ATP-binding protein [Aliiglaciecola sp. LCG003]|uniref:sensor histidine kinase n=1 Tax=Aliiglaciecola sp. LCG003 TaxID=3053655 RepID=UPI002572CE9D|nr:ATP-binding protein [Aliiglaciecola sp. LCG003]WJG10824.1 ATP-binding protein [Aliiglaciecola sp. LCG003]